MQVGPLKHLIHPCPGSPPNLESPHECFPATIVICLLPQSAFETHKRLDRIINPQQARLHESLDRLFRGHNPLIEKAIPAGKRARR